ncbi:MAG: hypothetical protein AB7E60_09510 [Sphingobium sp.]
MTQQPAETAETPHSAEANEESAGQFLHRLYAEGRAYAQIEVERQKRRAALIGAGIRDAVILGVIALMLLFATLVALLVGLIIALAPAMGALTATGAVLGGALGVTVILLLLAWIRIGRMKKAIAP